MERTTSPAATVWLGILVLAVVAAVAPHRAEAQSICESCELQAGLGATYHFWGPTGGVVLPVTVDWSDNRYELGFFRVATTQLLADHAYREPRVMADPYWGMSLSRRWRFIERGPVSGFVGFGLAARTESDQLSATRLDFAEQLGVRFRLPGDHVTGELTLRHWSNAGIRLPNHGQDFATLTFRLNSRLFGVPSADMIRIDPSFARARAPLPAGAEAGTANLFRGQMIAALSSPGDLYIVRRRDLPAALAANLAAVVPLIERAAQP